MDALTADIRLLGDLLGKVILRVAGQEAFDLEEEVRAGTKRPARNPSVEDARRLRQRLEQLDLPGSACSSGRSRSSSTSSTSPSSRPASAFCASGPAEAPREPAARASRRPCASSAARGVRPEELGRPTCARRCCARSSRPTPARRGGGRSSKRSGASPTRWTAWSASRLLPREREAALAVIAEEIEALWMSDLVRVNRPTVLDEVRQGLEVVEGALFDLVPRIYRETARRRCGAVYPEYRGPLAGVSAVRQLDRRRPRRQPQRHARHHGRRPCGMHQQTVLRCYLDRVGELARPAQPDRRLRAAVAGAARRAGRRPGRAAGTGRTCRRTSRTGSSAGRSRPGWSGRGDVPRRRRSALGRGGGRAAPRASTSAARSCGPNCVLLARVAAPGRRDRRGRRRARRPDPARRGVRPAPAHARRAAAQRPARRGAGRDLRAAAGVCPDYLARSPDERLDAARGANSTAPGR